MNTTGGISGFDGPMTPELHLKMSKKIAQLTKVVYALNTKNDEHEAHVMCLQEAHDVEIKKVLRNAEDQIIQLQSVVDNQTIEKEMIAELKQRVLEYESNNRNMVKELNDYKRNTTERESVLKKAYDEQMSVLSMELEALKADYNVKVSEIKSTSSNADRSGSLLQNIKEKYDNEIALLRELNENKLNELQREKEGMLAKHEQELDMLRQKHQEELDAIVKNEKTSLTTTYKAQIEQLENEVSTLKQQMSHTEQQFASKLAMLEADVGEAESKYASCMEEKTRLENENDKLQMEVNDLEEKFMETTRDLDLSLQRVSEVEKQLKEQRNAVLRQAEENAKKSGQIGMLDELQHAHSVENKRLQFEMKKLEDRYKEKEEEVKQNKVKHSKAINIWEEKCNMLKKEINLKNEEIQRLKEEYRLSLDEQQAAATERENTLQQQRQDEVRKVKEAYDKAMEEALAIARENAQSIRAALEQEARNEKNTLIKEYESKLRSVDEERMLLQGKVNNLTDEFERLTNQMSSSQTSLSVFEREKTELMNKVNEKQKQLEILHSELKDKVKLLQSLRIEFDKEVEAHKESVQQREQYTTDKVHAKQQELDLFWSEKLKTELTTLEQELLRKQSQSRNSEIKKLKDSHLQEFMEAERMWKDKVSSLQEKVASLEKAITVLNVESLKKEMSLNEQSKNEYEELNFRLQQLKKEHAAQLQTLEEEHSEALARQMEMLMKEQKNVEEKLVLSHRQTVHELTKANKLSVDALKDQLEQKRQMDINTTIQASKRELDTQLARVRKECLDEKELKLHEMKMLFDDEKEDLQRELEMRDREMQLLNDQITELKRNNMDKDINIAEYQKKIQLAESNYDDMRETVDEKLKEILQIKQDAVTQIKKREKRLQALHKSETKVLQENFVKEKEELKFRHQNEVSNINLEISDLKLKLHEADERYQNRPARIQDLNRIAELEGHILDRDERINHLIDEKKFYELELVNRESNYNKVFSSAPKIGVLNPTVKPTKGKRGSDPIPPPKNFAQNRGSTKARPTKLIPLSKSRTSSLESIVSQTLSTTRATMAEGAPQRVIPNAFVETRDTVVPPT